MIAALAAFVTIAGLIVIVSCVSAAVIDRS